MLAAELYPEWHKSVVKTLESIHTNKLFKTLYGSNNTCGYLKQFLVTALSLLDPFQPLTFDHLSEVYTSQVSESAHSEIPHLTVIRTFLFTP